MKHLFKTLGIALLFVALLADIRAQTTPQVITMQDAATATGNGTAIVIAVSAAAPGANLGAVGIQITGTFSATVTFEATTDGTNWTAVMATNLADDARATTATAAGHYTILYGSAIRIRARISSYSSGAVTVKGRLIPGLTARLTSGGGGGGGGAPTDATYITQTPNGSLSAEQALSSLASGIMRVATTTGVVTSLTDSAGIAANISDETGTGALVFATSPTLTTPTIASFANAGHDHSNAAGGGQISLTNAVTGDLPFANFVQAGSAGFVGATGAGDYSHRTPAQVTAALDAFVGDSGSGGTKGLVPAPTTGDAAKYLKGDGTWASVSAAPGGSDTQLQRNNAGAFGGISGFTSDGTNVTAGSGNLRATSPRFTTDISDTNGNEVFKITATASAVNELTIANAATGANPIVTASGGDANVGIDWLLKGTGTFNLTGNATQAAEIRLYEDTDNGTNYTAFKVGVQAGNVTYTLPTADGSSGQVLSTNGSGVLSWATGGGGGGYATIQEEGTNLTARTTLNFVGSSFTAADDTTRTNVTSDSDLDALASNSTNGLWARTGAGTGSARTLTAGTSAGLTITNGDGVSGNPTVDFATTNTAGLGFSLPGNGGLPFVTDSSNALAGSANEVRVALFYAPVRITVDRVGLNGVTDSASQNAGVGIYSADGNTKICDSGAISTTAWAGAANYALSASCTFGPGYFYFAWTASSTTPTVRSGAAITNFFAPLNNGTGTVLGTAANTSSGGVLPSTLGSLTDSNSLAIPIVRFYKN